MSDREFVGSYLSGLSDVALATSATLGEAISSVTDMVESCLMQGGKLMYCGNGGSAADAQHIAAEYVVRFRASRRPLAAIALTTDTSLLTATANDFTFEHVFERQVQALGRTGDILFLHSTSGESENLLRAASAAQSIGVKTIALLARGGGRLLQQVDYALVVPTDNGAHAQELHLAISHIICDLIEQRITRD